MLTKLMLLAAEAPDKIKELRGRFGAAEEQTSSMSGKQFAGLLLVGLGLLVLFVLIVARIREDRGRQGPALRKMCRKMGVGRKQRRLLMAVAHSEGFDSPVSLLLSRGTFDFAVQHYVRKNDSARSELVKLRQLIFG